MKSSADSQKKSASQNVTSYYVYCLTKSICFTNIRLKSVALAKSHTHRIKHFPFSLTHTYYDKGLSALAITFAFRLKIPIYPESSYITGCSEIFKLGDSHQLIRTVISSFLPACRKSARGSRRKWP